MSLAIFVSDLEEELLVKGPNGIDIGKMKLFLLLYVDLLLYLENHQRNSKML